MSNRIRIAGKLSSLVAAALSLSSTARSATLRVPQDYSTITGAANVAQRGDSILVDCGGNYCDYENEQITLRQGVVMRGMEEVYPDPHMQIRNSVINLLEESPSPDDTTRVEHFSIFSPPFHETVQVYTPRSSITDCYFWTSGPYDYTTVRVWEGGVIARNYFSGTGECNGMEARQGTVKVVGNAFIGLFTSFALYNATASETAALFLRITRWPVLAKCTSTSDLIPMRNS